MRRTSSQRLKALRGAGVSPKIYSTRPHVQIAEGSGGEKKATQWTIKAASPVKFKGNVLLACRFYRPNFQRIDTDNLLKHICDAANEILWDDDCQITMTIGETLYDKDNPRTIIMAANHHSSMSRGDDAKVACAHCGKLTKQAIAVARRSKPKYCGRECMTAARLHALGERLCICGKTFKPVTRTQNLCSPECRALKLRGRPKSKDAKPLSNCTACGKQLAHYRGGRCRTCWKADPQVFPGEDPEALDVPGCRIDVEAIV